MPVRNIMTIGLAIVTCLASYSIAVRNRYASIFSEAMEIVESEALIEIPRRELFDSAMDGMLGRLDANSWFVSEDDFPGFQEDLEQQFVGVGLHFNLDPENNCLRVVSPIPGKPAWKAGIRVGDLIMAIDGQSTAGMESDAAVRKIRGPLGTPVVLDIARAGTDDLMPIEIVREEIPVASVLGDTMREDGTWEFVLESSPRIGYIRLLEFGRKSTDELRAALASLDGKVDGLILDLRDNPGGLLDAAVEISDMFIGREVLVVETRRRDMSVTGQEFARSKTEIDVDLPLVVLVNENSASASEIVAACLQDHDRAAIAGSRTFGKGTVQDLIQLEPNRSVLRLTTSSYWRPSGKNIDRTVLVPPEPGQYGVLPDPGLDVSLSDEETMNIRRLRTLRDLNGIRPDPDQPGVESAEWLESDEAMQKAIEHLQARMFDRSA